MVILIILGLGSGCIYGLVAIGYSLEYQTTGVVDFAQGGYVVIGGVSTYWYLTSGGMPYAVAVILGVVTAATMGVILAVFVLVPLRRRRVPQFVLLLATIVYANILTGVIQVIFGTSPIIIGPWFPSFNIPYNGGTIAGQYVLTAIVTAVVCVGLVVVLRRTIVGRAMRATGSDRSVAELLGVSASRMSLLAVAGTAAIAGLAGAVVAPVALMSYNEVLIYGLYGVTAAVLGGFGNIWAGFLGGIVLGLMDALVGRYMSSSYQDAIVFLLLFIALIARPSGLLGIGARVAHE